MALPKKHLYMKRSVKRIRTSRTTPEEAELALHLHAATMKKALGMKSVSVSLANDDLLYRSKIFLSYLPEARAIIKANRGEPVNDSNRNEEPHGTSH